MTTTENDVRDCITHAAPQHGLESEHYGSLVTLGSRSRCVPFIAGYLIQVANPGVFVVFKGQMNRRTNAGHFIPSNTFL